MRNLSLVLIAAVSTIAVTQIASAAPASRKKPVPVAVPYSWTGFYVGGNIGYSWGNASSNYNEPAFANFGLPVPISTSQRLDGLIGGPQIGYNWQANSMWVLGVEADFQWSGEKGSSSVAYHYGTRDPVLTLTNNADIQWFGTVRGRVGVLITPTILAYGTGGLAYGRISASGAVNDGISTFTTWSFGGAATNVGWTVGGGIEGAVPNTTNWTWKVEYLYVDLGTVGGNNVGPFLDLAQYPYSWSTRVTDNILRGGLNLRF